MIPIKDKYENVLFFVLFFVFVGIDVCVCVCVCGRGLF